MGMNDRKPERKARGKTKPKGFDFKGYVEVTLTAGQREEVASEYELTSGDELLASLCELVDNDYEVKFKILDEGTTIACQIMDASGGRDTAGYILTGFGEDTAKALFVAVFKHVVICQRVWDVSKPTREKWG